MFTNSIVMEKELTRAEEQIMDYLWQIGEGFVRDIIDRIPEPRQAYTTVSTIVRILEKKGFIGHKSFGNAHRYYPLISREQYVEFCAGNLVKRHFSDSLTSLVSFFTSKKDMSLKELEELLALINEEVDKKKKS